MPHKRLFWKFFTFLWLAQLMTVISVGATLALLKPYHPSYPPVPRSELKQPLEANFPPLESEPYSLMPLFTPLIAGSIVSLIVAGWLASYVARPINLLRKAFEAEAQGKLDTRIGDAMGTKGDELTDLGKNFDRMAERLQHTVEGQRRLLHHVSHELRSPLCRLQAAADLMQQQPKRADELIHRIQSDTARIDLLVSELLTLARLEARAETLLNERFKLAELTEELAEEARFEAAPRGCRIELALAPQLELHANIELLRRAIENILRNAVRHAPPNTKIVLRSIEKDGQAQLTIIDQGEGVNALELAAIFEPFYRGKNARPFEGYGLGLTIARQIAELYGGSIHAENLPGEGFAVSLSLPLAKSP